MELLKALQASVSHDMRAPLAAIIATSNVLLTEFKDQKLVRYLMPINTASKMLHCQVNDLLDSSLLLKGKFVMHLARFDLVKAVQEVVAVIEYGNSRQNKIEIFF